MKKNIKHALGIISIISGSLIYYSYSQVSSNFTTVNTPTVATQASLDELKNTIANDLNTLNTQISAVNKKNEDLRTTITDLKSSLQQAQDAVKKANDKIATLEKALAETNKTIGSYVDKTKSDLQDQILRLGTQTTKQLDAVSSAQSSLKDTVSKMSVTVDILKVNAGVMTR